MKLVYHAGYDLSLGDHVFPSIKFRLIHEQLAREGFVSVEPSPASMDDLMRVHTREWASGLRYGTLSYHQILQLEIPYSSRMVDAKLLAAGGTILAARLALAHGVAANIGGGFHHAFAGHGEGFCAVNDIAIGIRALQHEGLIQRAMVLDLDVHQGNGTAAIFADDSSVFTISLHQLANYPERKPFSNIDAHLPDGLGDRDYLRFLKRLFAGALRGFRPDLLVYVAGSDPYGEDKLGGLALTLDGLRDRDELVFRLAREAGVPAAITLAGGYALLLQDTVTIHANTIRAAAAAYA
jgi:acetoin utilization deacetylase AcuC-like enzyme